VPAARPYTCTAVSDKDGPLRPQAPARLLPTRLSDGARALEKDRADAPITTAGSIALSGAETPTLWQPLLMSRNSHRNWRRYLFRHPRWLGDKDARHAPAAARFPAWVTEMAPLLNAHPERRDRFEASKDACRGAPCPGSRIRALEYLLREHPLPRGRGSDSLRIRSKPWAAAMVARARRSNGIVASAISGRMRDRRRG
jgi:hypothetical protein